MGFHDSEAVEVCLQAAQDDIEDAAAKLVEWEDNVTKLALMGFDKSSLRRVLQETRGDFSSALEILLAGL